MNEENIALNDPDETSADVSAAIIDPSEIDDDWNSAPEENWGTDASEDDDRQEQGTDEAAPLTDTGRTKEEMKQQGADQSFTLKHLSDVRTVGRDEVITLAQKGLDYDRIRGKFEEATAELSKADDAVSFLKELASTQGITPEELIDATRAQLLVQKHGVQPSLAAERVAAMRSQRGTMGARAASPEAIATEKRQSDIREFLAEYGTGVDPKSIPGEVWQSVAKGKTLLGAYQAWELKKLRLESEASRKNSENKLRSAGSRLSFGNQRPRDEIEDNWYDS